MSTFERKENKEKHIIMDLKGNMLKTIFLPLPEEPSYTSKALGRENRFWGIIKDKFYYLKLNENLDCWELHVADMK